MKNQSKKLTKFYNQYYKWLEEGAKGSEFDRGFGLCHNLDNWACIKYPHYVDDILEEMKDQFSDAGLSREYPFNRSSNSYWKKTGVHHLKKSRIKWVKNHSL